MIARAERLSALDGLRGAMALLVAFYHLSMWARWAAVGSHENTLVAALGLYSVQGFFMLSGVCFAHLYRGVALRGRRLAQFHVKRFFRIAPLYYLSVGLSLAAGLAMGPPPTRGVLLENFTLSFGFIHPNHSLVVGGWSIGVEYVFYAALPVLLWAVRRPPWLWLLTVLLALAAARDSQALAALPASERFHAYVSITNHAFLFGLGACVADARRRLRVRVPDAILPFAVLATGCAVYTSVSPVRDHFALVTGAQRAWGVALALALVTLAALSRDRSRWLTRAYRWLGELSFGVYMLHRLVHAALMTLPGVSDLPALARALLALLATVAAARLVYRFVERPAVALSERIAGSLAAPAPIAAAREGATRPEGGCVPPAHRAEYNDLRA